MISSYKQLTGRYLKANKKRTLLTIIGIILSIALISTIGFFMVGMQEAQIEDIKNGYGSWHVSFSAPEEDIISKVANNPKVLKSGMYQQGEQINIENDLKLSPIIASNKALELLPMKIKEGRFPRVKNEVALEKWILPYFGNNIKVGDNIKIKNEEYTLTGILQDSVGTQSQKNGRILLISDNLDKAKAVLLAEISPKTNLKNAVKEITALTDKKVTRINGKGQKVQISSVVKNSLLIDMQGGGDWNSGLAQVYSSVAVIIGIVVIATIAVIYNSFQISVVERIKQFGLLRAIGMTPKQIRKIVLREATILSVIGIPIGILLGISAISAIGLIFKIIGGETVVFMKLTISPSVIMISVFVGLISIYVSAIIPAFFAGKISPLVAINSRTSITKEKIKKRRSFIIGKLFKFEGMLAVKNIKRNKKRYRVTVFSIVISIVLFITFKSFMDMTLNISKNLNESKNVHFLVQNNSQDLVIDNDFIENIRKLNSVDKIFKGYNSYNFVSPMDKDRVTDGGKMYGVSRNIDGKEKIVMNAAINIYDAAALEASKKYIQSGSIDMDRINSENGVILINKNEFMNDKTNKSYVGSVANLKVGDEIELQYNGENTNIITNSEVSSASSLKSKEQKGETKKVKIMAIVKEDPFNFNGDQSGLKIITTKEMAKRLMDKKDIKDINVTSLSISLKNVKDEEIVNQQLQNIIKSKSSLTLINYLDHNRDSKSVILMVRILVYGFIIVVSLIGSVNIINTITTNIILRKKEFASLKAIGLTQKSLKKMIVIEGLLYGIVGTIYGSIIACGLSYMIYNGMSGIREMVWPVPWEAMVIAAVASLVISYLSVLSPLARINKENLIEAVREDY